MTRSVAVLGAGGKMGYRVTRKLHEAGYDLRAVGIGAAGRARLAEAGIAPADAERGVSGAEVVVLALPETSSARSRPKSRHSSARERCL